MVILLRALSGSRSFWLVLASKEQVVPDQASSFSAVPLAGVRMKSRLSLKSGDEPVELYLRRNFPKSWLRHFLSPYVRILLGK